MSKSKLRRDADHWPSLSQHKSVEVTGTRLTWIAMSVGPARVLDKEAQVFILHAENGKSLGAYDYPVEWVALGPVGSVVFPLLSKLPTGNWRRPIEIALHSFH